MAATKTVFFGTTFAFEQTGVDDVVETFCNGYASNPEDAPFMSYDFKHHVFKIDKLDLLDDDTPMDVLRQLQHYTHKQTAENEIIDPKIRPLEGFIARLAPEYSGFRGPELLELDSGDWKGNPKDTLGAMQHAFTEWKPACGNIKILTEAVAQSIVNLTGTEIHPQPAQKTACLIGGDFNHALQKLKNLEPLLNLQYTQRESSTVGRNGNILVTTDTAARPLLGFQKLDFPGCPAYKRVIVPPRLFQSLPRKYVCEGRVMQDGRRAPHPNLDPANSSPTTRVGKSLLWNDYTYKEAGVQSNRVPRNAPGSATQSEVSAGPKLTNQKYLEPSKAAELQGWSQAIDSGVDPNEIAPEAPVEPTSRRRRQVAVDSDDEEDEQAPVTEPNDTMGSKHTATIISDFEPTKPPDDQRNNLSLPNQPDVIPDSAGTFDDDSQLLAGLPSQPFPHQVSVAPSVVASNLMSFTSNASQADGGPDYTGTLDDLDSSPPMESLRQRKTEVSSNGENDVPVNVRLASERNEATTSSRNPSPVRSIPSTRQPPPDGYPKWDTGSRSLFDVPVRGRGGKSTSSRGSGMSAARSSGGGIRPPPGLEHMARDTSRQPNELHSDSTRNPWEHKGPPKIDPAVAAAFGAPGAHQSVDEKSKHWENHKRFEGINVDARREEALSKIQAEIEAQEAAAAAAAKQQSDTGWSTVKGRNNQQKKFRGGLQQHKVGDDRPTFYNTMHQRAGNPGKQRGGKQQADSSTERLKRLKAIEDAYGPTPRAPPRATSSVGPTYSEMSNGKKKLLATNTHMAYANGDALQQELRIKEAESLTAELHPLIEHSRAFSGKLEFGLHFGQVLVPLDPQTNKSKGFGSKAWNEVFGPRAAVNGPSTSFTPILTTNGGDVDRALEMKSPLDPSARIFDKSSPGPSSVTYEFHCQSKKNESFLLVVQEDLKYEIRNSTATIGMVCMHCPAQVWDACAILQGAEYWHDPPKEIKDAVQSFVDSIYVPPSRKLTLYFRQPSGNVLTVNKPQMKRVSLHNCLLPGHEDVQLRITEHMELTTHVAPNDKRLWKAAELSLEDLVRDRSLHYEMCLVDNSINTALDVNSTLEVGELTNPDETGKSLLEGFRIQRLLELSVTILTKIDFIGLQNTGTMRHLDETRQRKEQSLPPALQSQIHPLMPASGFPFSGLRSGIGSAIVPGGSQVATELVKPIHGTRMNTQADFFQDETGQVFRKGLGGAIVPVAMEAPGSISEEPVGPDDSMSHAPAPRRPTDGQMGVGRARAKTPWDAMDNKPAGFW